MIKNDLNDNQNLRLLMIYFEASRKIRKILATIKQLNSLDVKINPYEIKSLRINKYIQIDCISLVRNR